LKFFESTAYIDTIILYSSKKTEAKEMIIGVDHIGIAVNSLTEALKIYEGILGLKLVKTKTVEEQRVKVALILAGGTKIELLQPTNEESSVAKFIAKKGEGIHHIAFRVSNVESSLEEIKRKGIALIDEKPRIGFEGHKIAFVHPKSTKNVLVELCEE
jgi:methylmalonyl-CoA/ethylmalonyl-CoA epimerase